MGYIGCNFSNRLVDTELKEYYTLYLTHCTLYTIHYTLYLTHCTLYTIHYTYCTLYLTYCTLYTIHYTYWTLYLTYCKSLYATTVRILSYTRIHCPKGYPLPRYNMKCSRENVILRGIFHLVSRFLYFSCYIAEIQIAFLTVSTVDNCMHSTLGHSF